MNAENTGISRRSLPAKAGAFAATCNQKKSLEVPGSTKSTSEAQNPVDGEEIHLWEILVFRS